MATQLARCTLPPAPRSLHQPARLPSDSRRATAWPAGHSRRVCHAGSQGNGSGGPQSIDDDSSSGLGKLRYNKWEDRPPELQDLNIRDDGLLIDQKTGKVINEFGATRFDVAVRALRGELDPAPWVENTERNPGVLMTKLVNFPTAYTFTVVGKVTPESPKQAFVEDMCAIIAKSCQVELKPKDVAVQDRLKGKYASLSVTCVVRAPELITKTYELIGQDARVKMKF